MLNLKLRLLCSNREELKLRHQKKPTKIFKHANRRVHQVVPHMHPTNRILMINNFFAMIPTTKFKRAFNDYWRSHRRRKMNNNNHNIPSRHTLLIFFNSDLKLDCFFFLCLKCCADFYKTLIYHQNVFFPKCFWRFF